MEKIGNNKFVSPEERKRKNEEYIKQKGIAYLETLPLVETSLAVELKDLDTICQRAIASLLAIQLASDIQLNNNYEESKELFLGLLKEYKVENQLLAKEKRLFNHTYSKQDAIDVTWNYEAYWSLVWALGLIDDIKDASEICDCMKAITLVGDCYDYEEFKNKCKLRSIEEVLDMLDLYYRYHWACEEKRINPDTSIGNLNPEVVMERRKGLEWLISKLTDWDDIALNT